MKIVSLNIHKGFSVGNRKFILEQLRKDLRQSQADIVFLQEVIGEHAMHQQKIDAWPIESQFEFLADTVWPYHAYGKNAIYGHGHHGNAVLSHQAFTQRKNLNATIMSISQRGILHGIIDNNVHLLCIHFGLFEFERTRQVKQLIDYIDTKIPRHEPIIMAGDFNDWRRFSHDRLIEQLGLVEAHSFVHGVCAKTYPAFFPVFSLDRIYLRGFEVKSCTRLRGTHWRNFSDHCGLVAELVKPTAQDYGAPKLRAMSLN